MRKMTRTLTTLALLLADTVPALAVTPEDGVSAVKATVEMRVAAIYCGLNPPAHFRDYVAQKALDFTGMDSDAYTLRMILAADNMAAQLNRENGMMEFCVDVQKVYGGVR